MISGTDTKECEKDPGFIHCYSKDKYRKDRHTCYPAFKICDTHEDCDEGDDEKYCRSI